MVQHVVDRDCTNQTPGLITYWNGEEVIRGQALGHIAQADVDLKSSRLPSDVTFERLVVALCKATREGPRARA